MKAHPTDRAVEQGPFESHRRGIGPVIGRIIQLHEDLVAGEELAVDLLRVVYLGQREAVVGGERLQPLHGGVGETTVLLAALGQHQNAPLLGIPVGIRAALAQYAVANRASHVAAVVIARIIPIHRAAQPHRADIVALDGNRPRILETQHELARLPVGQIRNLRRVVPTLRELLRRTYLAVIGEVGVTLAAATVKRQSHHQFRSGNARSEVRLHRPRSGHVAAVGRGIERSMMFGRPPHVVGHDVHEIEIRHHGTEIDIPRVAHRGYGQKIFFTQRLAQIAHQKRKVSRVARRRRYSSGRTGGIFPIDVNAVESERLDQKTTMSCETPPPILVGRHLAEAAAAPSSHG